VPPGPAAWPGRRPVLSRRLLRGTERLQHLAGTRLLVGVTVRAPDGGVLHREQFCGHVLEVRDGVVVVERPHAPGEPAMLPSDAAAYNEAAPGSYRLPNGETVVDPDFVTTWDVVGEPPDGPDTPPEPV
jgi:hypothetical protein